MNCSRCQSPRLFSFQAGADAIAKPENLPVVCRDCGLITVAGAPVSLPPELEAHARELAAAAVEAGQQAVRDLQDDPSQPVATYFSRVYRNAYLDGFWRALLFWRHNGKEGRLKRVRELWHRLTQYPILQWTESFEADPMDRDRLRKVYAELEHLLTLGEHDASRPTHERSPLPEGHA